MQRLRNRGTLARRGVKSPIRCALVAILRGYERIMPLWKKVYEPLKFQRETCTQWNDVEISMHKGQTWYVSMGMQGN